MRIPKDVGNFLLVWVPVVLLLALSYRSNRWIGANPVLRPRLERIEPFQGSNGKPADPEGAPEVTGSLAPADASLESMRQSYALLKDSLSAKDDVLRPSFSAATCYDADFQKRVERVGNFRQMTNNYKRGTPDSCSAPLHDLVGRQYKPEVIAFSGCLNPKATA
jgi:hypothetical protein